MEKMSFKKWGTNKVKKKPRALGDVAEWRKNEQDQRLNDSTKY